MVAEYLAKKFINAIALISILTMISCVFIKLTYDHVFAKKGVESKVKIVPKIKLEVNGLKIDTIYIYQNK